MAVVPLFKAQTLARGVTVWDLLNLVAWCTCAVYDLEGPGRDGVVKYFRKVRSPGASGCTCPLAVPGQADALSWPVAQPYMMVTLMFLGMAFCLPLSYLEQWHARRRAAVADPGDASKPLLDAGPALDVCTHRRCAYPSAGLLRGTDCQHAVC